MSTGKTRKKYHEKVRSVAGAVYVRKHGGFDDVCVTVDGLRRGYKKSARFIHPVLAVDNLRVVWLRQSVSLHEKGGLAERTIHDQQPDDELHHADFVELPPIRVFLKSCNVHGGMAQRESERCLMDGLRRRS